MTWNPHRYTEVQRVLEENGLWLVRSRGQNYLIDRAMASRIATMVPHDIPVFEVGCGLGSLTILLPPRRVYALEIDHGIFELVRSLVDDPAVSFIEGDFLTFDIQSLGEKHLFFLSNLPYSISGEALRRFIDIPCFEDGIVMVQKEFYERMTAPRGAKTYGVFAILIQSFLEVKRLFSVPRGCFFPVPSVDSVVIRLHKREAVMETSPQHYEKLQQAFRSFLLEAFGSKRKTLFNNLKRIQEGETLLQAFRLLGIGEHSRPEEITVDQWQKLFLLLGDKTWR